MERKALDARLRELAGQQHSVVSWRQARGLGGSRGAMAARAASTDWVALSPRVLRLAGSIPTFEQRCMAAALDAGERAAVSHLTAARLWRLPGFRDDEIHVSRIRGATRHRTDLGLVHGPESLPSSHVVIRNAIPVTTVARTLFDLAGSLHPGRLERALENALTRRFTTTVALRQVTADLAERGRAGSTLMRILVAERGRDYIPIESGLEARFLSLLRSSGLPEPKRQVDVGGEHWVGRVDFAYLERRLLIEVDSALHHSSKLDREADGRRDAQLTAAGFRVIRITEDQVWYRPREAVGAIRRALDASVA